MGARGFKSKYADRSDTDGGIPQHRLAFDSNARAYVPTASELDLDGTHWSASSEATGDWSWKPGRDKLLGDDMVTFKGVPPSAAEMFRGRMHQPG